VVVAAEEESSREEASTMGLPASCLGGLAEGRPGPKVTRISLELEIFTWR
jgi:hypothetical protein